MHAIMSDATRILQQIVAGDPTASEQLLPLVYEELKRLAQARMAGEAAGQTLQATALVHEAYLRLVGPSQQTGWEGRGHFFAAAAEAMRRILINRARDRNRLKREGGWNRVELDAVTVADTATDEQVLAIDEALNRLMVEHPACGELVKLRFFTGLTAEQAAEALRISRRTADRNWAFARAWLVRELGAGEG
jgi:RNA polymerase sigma factor (TIGR02999 family)